MPVGGSVDWCVVLREGRGATLSLRSPSAVRRRIALPMSVAEPIAPQRVQELMMQPEIPSVAESEPFEVLVFEADSAETDEKMQTR